MTQSGNLATANRYRFSSKEVHSQSGMYYYGFRFYEPHLQRWVNRDPIGEFGGVNLYGFCRNSPTDRRDAFGLFFGDTASSYIIRCAGFKTGKPIQDFVVCICLFAPDSEECEKKLGPCLSAKPDVFTLCTCACQALEDEEARKRCVDACKKAKKVKKFCDDIKKKMPEEPDFP
jgi:RHS repeat-associated protein